MINQNSKGVSLIEAFLAAIIFIIAVAAVFSTLNSLRKPAVNNEQATAAALVLSNFLDDIRSKISGEDLNAPGGAVGAYTNVLNPSVDSCPAGLGAPYQICYNVTLEPSGARKVDANITWADAM